jgi:hypothetical protein
MRDRRALRPRLTWAGGEATQRSPREMGASRGATGAVRSHAPRTRSSGIPLDQADWLARLGGGRADANGSDSVRTEKDPSVNPIEQRSPPGAPPVPGVCEGHDPFLGDDIAKGPPQLVLSRPKASAQPLPLEDAYWGKTVGRCCSVHRLDAKKGRSVFTALQRQEFEVQPQLRSLPPSVLRRSFASMEPPSGTPTTLAHLLQERGGGVQIGHAVDAVLCSTHHTVLPRRKGKRCNA